MKATEGLWGLGQAVWVVGEGARGRAQVGRGLLRLGLGRSGPTVQGGAGGRLQGSPGSVPQGRGSGGGELGLCSLSRGSLGLGLPDREVGRLGGGPRLTQQCLGAGWESLILPGNDGGPRPCVSDHPLPPAAAPHGWPSPHTLESPSSAVEGAANKVALGWRVAHWTQWF